MPRRYATCRVRRQQSPPPSLDALVVFATPRRGYDDATGTFVLIVIVVAVAVGIRRNYLPSIRRRFRRPIEDEECDEEIGDDHDEGEDDDDFAKTTTTTSMTSTTTNRLAIIIPRHDDDDDAMCRIGFVVVVVSFRCFVFSLDASRPPRPLPPAAGGIRFSLVGGASSDYGRGARFFTLRNEK